MISFNKDFEQQKSFFTKAKIDTSVAGFYDDTNFLAIERSNPGVLNNYASFVKQYKFNKEYLNHTEKVVKKVSEILYHELKVDGRKGACADISSVLSRILEKEGIWNYVVSGSLSLTFDPDCKILKKYFWQIDDGFFDTAHAWVVVPPFKIVDLAIKQQPYKSGEELYLPDIIMQKDTKFDEVDLSDIIEPNILREFKSKFGVDKNRILRYISPHEPDFSAFFRPESFYINKVAFKYTPTSIKASDVPLEKITSLYLCGKYGHEIYNKLIKPELKDIL